MAGVYQSPLVWDPSRPETTIVTCVDGRWYPHFQEFARTHLGAGPRTDFVAVPGGIEPLTMLVNGMPVAGQFGKRTMFFEPAGPGFVRLTVIDAKGAADSVVVRLQ